MKKIFILITTYLLTVTMLTGCAAGASKTLSRGIWTDKSYKNEYANISYTAPDDWVIGTDEEMATMMGLGVEIMGNQGEALTTEMLEQLVINDSFTQDPVTGSSISVLFEKLTDKTITGDAYLESIKVQMQEVEELNYVFEDAPIYKGELSNETYTVLKATEPDYKVTQYYYVRNIGDYMSCVIITLLEDVTFEAVSARFN